MSDTRAGIALRGATREGFAVRRRRRAARSANASEKIGGSASPTRKIRAISRQLADYGITGTKGRKSYVPLWLTDGDIGASQGIREETGELHLTGPSTMSLFLYTGTTKSWEMRALANGDFGLYKSGSTRIIDIETGALESSMRFTSAAFIVNNLNNDLDFRVKTDTLDDTIFANGALEYVRLGGGVSHQLVAKTTTYTALTTDCFITCDASGGAFTVTLPAVSTVTGQIYHIKKTDSSANAVTTDGNASETIDGATTQVNSTQYNSISIVSDGSNWHIY